MPPDKRNKIDATKGRELYLQEELDLLPFRDVLIGETSREPHNACDGQTQKGEKGLSVLLSPSSLSH